jgi:tRNA threonylcarbamoyladenosine dehydratase
MILNLDSRRFGGVSRLYGTAGLAKLQTAHVVVIGIGGVGSWAAEALARNAVGNITLIDLDNIAESNVNRQIHAKDGNFGKAKVTAMAERIRAINPSCQVREIEDFVTLDNASKMLDFHSSVMIDCTDDVKAKIALTLNCKATKTPLIMSGSAGGRLDPTRIQTADLSAVTNDKLLAKVRNQLRRDYHFPKAQDLKKTATKKSAKFGITCVYSDEPSLMPNEAENELCALEKSDNIITDALQPQGLSPQNIPAEAGYSYVKPNISAAADDAKNPHAITGLNCAGYGSSVCVTAPMGFTLAALAINHIVLT